MNIIARLEGEEAKMMHLEEITPVTNAVKVTYHIQHFIPIKN